MLKTTIITVVKNAKKKTKRCKMLEQEEVNKVSKNMIEYGGSFVKAIGEALKFADQVNQNKVKTAFPIYWDKYKKMVVKNGTEE